MRYAAHCHTTHWAHLCWCTVGSYGSYSTIDLTKIHWIKIHISIMYYLPRFAVDNKAYNTGRWAYVNVKLLHFFFHKSPALLFLLSTYKRGEGEFSTTPLLHPTAPWYRQYIADILWYRLQLHFHCGMCVLCQRKSLQLVTQKWVALHWTAFVCVCVRSLGSIPRVKV